MTYLLINLLIYALNCLIYLINYSKLVKASSICSHICSSFESILILLNKLSFTSFIRNSIKT